MPKKNFELMHKVLDQIEAHPETWDQENWAKKLNCGTSYCFAGNALVIAYPNGHFKWEKAWDAAWGRDADEEGQVGYEFRRPHRSYEPVETAAQRILGLYDDEATSLFADINGLDHIKTIISEWEMYG